MNAAQSKGSAFFNQQELLKQSAQTGGPFFLKYVHQDKDIASFSKATPAKGINMN